MSEDDNPILRLLRAIRAEQEDQGKGLIRVERRPRRVAELESKA